MTPRILVAEDNENLAQMLARFLASKGFGVQVVHDGGEVLPLISSYDPHLLLLDLRLPGMGGPEILHRIRKSPNAALPVIIMSGVYKGERYQAETAKLGVRHYLEKPFSPQILFDAVADLLQKGELAAAPKPEPPPAPAPAAAPLPPDPSHASILGIYERRATGLLSEATGSPVLFISGEPVGFISRGREDFPSFLMERGKISLGDMRQFLNRKEEKLFFTQAGLLTYEQLQEESRFFLMKRLLDLWSAAGLQFQEEMQAEPPFIPLPFPQFLYELYREGHIPVDLRRFAGTNASQFPNRTPRFYRLVNLLTLNVPDMELVGKIDGKTKLGEIATDAGKASLCLFLYQQGMISLSASPTAHAEPDFPVKSFFNAPVEEEAAPEETVDFEDLVEEISENVQLGVAPKVDAPLSSDEIDFEQAVLRDHAFLKGKNYYEIFGLTRNSFTFDKLKEAYFKKSKEYSPEKFMMLSGSTQALAQEILSTLATAYNTLSNVVSKERYDEMLNADKVGLDGKQDDKLQAQVQLQSGKVFLEMHEYENAQKALQDAHTLNPANHEACAFLAWAIYRNPVNKGSKAARDKAKTLLSKSLQIRNNAEALAFRGWLLLDEGRDELAEGEFQKALKLNPKEPHSRKGLAQITEKREAEKKGIFKKFFS